MQNTPEIFDRILSHDLQPWLPENNPDELFTPLLKEVKPVQPNFINKYELAFLRPFNSKTKYYERVISNAANEYCNRVIELINEDTQEKLIKYWLDNTLNKKLKSRLIKIGELITQEDYQLNQISGRNVQFNQDTDHKINTYIVQLLKIALIKCYLEIQDQFSERIDDQLIETDFYTQLLFEVVPETSYLKQLERIIANEPVQNNEPTEEGGKSEEIVEFIPRQSDFRGTNRSTVRYSDIRNQEMFSKFEIELFISGIIDEDYNYTKIHGNQNLLAALYKILIDKNYFRKTNSRTGKSFEPHHIRQYLDHRYSVDTTQQFKKCTTEKIEYFKYKYSWVENIDFCR